MSIEVSVSIPIHMREFEVTVTFPQLEGEEPQTKTETIKAFHASEAMTKMQYAVMRDPRWLRKGLFLIKAERKP